ncbi:MAG: ATP-NAD kinase family protein [Candidatus Heimdallarchaeota archaeon]
MTPKSIGIITNPIAGMGGRVGLKGTDSLDILQEARRRGAEPQAHTRTAALLIGIMNSSECLGCQFIVPPGKMGADIISMDKNLSRRLKWHVLSEMQIAAITTRKDTITAANNMLNKKIDLLIFVGGDGTARDVLEVVGKEIPILGIPAGVKIHSGVFTQGIAAGVELICGFINDRTQLVEAEVIDLDEQAYRENRLSTRLFGIAKVPHIPTLLQPTKLTSGMINLERDNIQGIIDSFRETVQPNVMYLLGPGSTLKELAHAFGQGIHEEKTLLGIDAVLNGQIIDRDLSEGKILNLLEVQSFKGVRIIVTPIGGQGFVFGRGNQPFSPQVIQKVGISQIEVVATRTKLALLPQKLLRVDTGDPLLDAQFPKHIKVLTDYNFYEMIRLETC